MKEAILSRAIQIAAADAGHRLFRNTIGYDEARRVHYGLANGSADLIGWTRDGRFASIEVKVDRNKPTKEQARWCEAINAAGGIGAVVWSVDEALAALAR